MKIERQDAKIFIILFLAALATCKELINLSPQKVTTYLLRLCHINSRSESFVFKNVIPRENRSGFASRRILSPFGGSG